MLHADLERHIPVSRATSREGASGLWAGQKPEGVIVGGNLSCLSSLGQMSVDLRERIYGNVAQGVCV